MMSDENDRKPDEEFAWEGDVSSKGEYVDKMFDDPDFVDPEEAEAQALRELEAGMVVEGPLQASLAACINRLDRVLKELSADYDPGERNLQFSLSPAAAPLYGLRDALEFGLTELRGRWSASPSVVRYLEGKLEMGRKQLVELGAYALTPEMGVAGLEAPAAQGRAAFAAWWEMAGLVERVYVNAAFASPKFMTTEALLNAEGRLDRRKVDSAGDFLAGGQLQLWGFVSGLSLMREGSAQEVESGVRLLMATWMGDVRRNLPKLDLSNLN